MARKEVGPTPASVRDALLRHVEAAVHALHARHLTDEGIHTARKHLKRARANLRLLRDAVGKAAYTRENAALRDAARPLSGVRDAKVLLETCETLFRPTRMGPRRILLIDVRRALEKARREARAELRVMNAAEDSAAALDAASRRVRRWRLQQSDASTLCKGLKRTYRRACDALEIARAEPTPPNLHEWRKQVKYLGQSMKAWESREGKPMKRMVKRADKLADCLGTDHDLVVFEERLEKLDAPSPVLPYIARSIAARREKLERKALKQGRRLFDTKPRAFVSRVTAG